MAATGTPTRCAACATTRRPRGTPPRCAPSATPPRSRVTSCAPCCAPRAALAPRRAAALLLGLLAGCGESSDATAPRAAPAASARPPSLLLVSFDTLRADHL